MVPNDPQVDKLVLWQTDEPKILPDDPYFKFGGDDTEPRKDSTPVVAASIKTKVRIAVGHV